MQLGAFVDVFGIVVVEFRRWDYLAGNRGLRLVVAQHRALDLPGPPAFSANALLDHDLAVELGSFFDSGP